MNDTKAAPSPTALQSSENIQESRCLSSEALVCGASISQIRFHTGHPARWIKAARDPETTRDHRGAQPGYLHICGAFTLELQPGAWSP